MVGRGGGSYRGEGGEEEGEGKRTLTGLIWRMCKKLSSPSLCEATVSITPSSLTIVGNSTYQERLILCACACCINSLILSNQNWSGCRRLHIAMTTRQSTGNTLHCHWNDSSTLPWLPMSLSTQQTRNNGLCKNVKHMLLLLYTSCPQQTYSSVFGGGVRV